MNTNKVASFLWTIANDDNDPRSWEAYFKYIEDYGPESVHEMIVGDDMPLEDVPWYAPIED